MTRWKPLSDFWFSIGIWLSLCVRVPKWYFSTSEGQLLHLASGCHCVCVCPNGTFPPVRGSCYTWHLAVTVCACAQMVLFHQWGAVVALAQKGGWSSMLTVAKLKGSGLCSEWQITDWYLLHLEWQFSTHKNAYNMIGVGWEGGQNIYKFQNLHMHLCVCVCTRTSTPNQTKIWKTMRLP